MNLLTINVIGERSVGLKLLTWNIRQGGSVKRIPRIVEQLSKHSPDVLLLTEYWEGEKGEEIKRLLRENGYEYMISSNGAIKQNSLLFASQYPFEVVPSFFRKDRNSERWLEIRIAQYDLHIVGVHIPANNNDVQEKLEFWQEVNAFAEEQGNSRTVIMGDYNTGLEEDTQGTPFVGPQYMQKLVDLGWIDTWRYTHGSFSGYSWYSTKGNGFRIDHVFVAPALKENILESYFSHQERLNGLSDHSILLVELQI
ncbi:endonuclease/exonuclease/phosphatase family protein [Bacillus mycoides]|uniref:endonuclease/exonuclease/phosphatase family protein n=1 Tax=Bacillus mycoides TaxID=1405 RepID=UPI002113201D|nr:endonuclease/exonuclease/phosphatase family protein [Bacillus mycoides]MCQ6532279.1 endonuclease/exonuclease/phosphatase family protein [Bacillus mycoides]